MNSRALMAPSSNCNKLWLQALFVLSLLSTRSEAGDVTLGFLLPYNVSANVSTGFAQSGKQYASALVLAVEAVNNDSSLLPGHQITFVWNDTQCNEELSLKAMLYLLEKGVQAFIGPGCTCETQARLAAAANIPMVSYMCMDERLSDKTVFPTFSRTAPPISGLAPPLHALMKHFNWTRVGLIAQTTQQWSQWNALERGLREGGFVVDIARTMGFGVHYNPTNLLPEFEGLLQSVAKDSRVIILAMNYAYALQAMNYVAELGLNDGRFAFMIFDLELDPAGNTKKNLSLAQGKDPENRTLAFQSALLISVNNNISTEYLTFIEDVKKKSSGFPFYSLVQQGYTPPIQAAYLYDAVFQYAVALNKTLNSGGKISDGTKITQNLMGHLYKSILGYDRYINAVGDAGFNLVLMDYRHDNNGMFQQVGEFVVDDAGKHKLLLNNDLIIWPKNMPAPSTPPKCKSCGEHCYNGKAAEL